MSVKLRPTDVLFSLFIRQRDKWTCQRCGTRINEHDPNARKGLHNAHCVVGRGNEGTRFDTDNCHALCYGCHQYLTSNTEENKRWFIRRWGQPLWDTVYQRAQPVTKRNDAATKERIKQLLATLT